jgi:hypothetical protein
MLMALRCWHTSCLRTCGDHPFCHHEDFAKVCVGPALAVAPSVCRCLMAAQQPLNKSSTPPSCPCTPIDCPLPGLHPSHASLAPLLPPLPDTARVPAPAFDPDSSPVGYQPTSGPSPGHYDIPPLGTPPSGLPPGLHVDLVSPLGGMMGSPLSSTSSVGSAGSAMSRRTCARCGTSDTPKWRKDLQAPADSPL